MNISYSLRASCKWHARSRMRRIDGIRVKQMGMKKENSHDDGQW